MLNDREINVQVKCFLMISRNFGRPIDDGCAKFEHLWRGKGFENKFHSDAVGIALGYGYTKFIVVHRFLLCSLFIGVRRCFLCLQSFLRC